MDLLSKVKRELSESLEALKHATASGSAQDYATYRQLVGRAEAIQMTLDYIADLEQQYIDE